MAKAIENGTIGEDLRSQPDQIWTAEAIPNNTNVSSTAFKLGQTMAGVEIKVVCETGTTLASDLLIELQTSATEGGSYVTEVSTTVAAGAIVAGDELAKLILPREVADKIYSKIKLTTTAVQATGKVDAYPVLVS
jgi:hypothetical protein